MKKVPERFEILLPAPMRERIDRVAKGLGETRAKLIREAMEIHLPVCEERIRKHEEARAGRRGVVPTKPVGLGISRVPAPTIAAPVANEPTGEIERLARFVAAAVDETQRRLREDSVAAIVKATTTSRTDAEALSKSIDDRARVLQAEKPQKEPTRTHAGILPWTG